MLRSHTIYFKRIVIPQGSLTFQHRRCRFGGTVCLGGLFFFRRNRGLQKKRQ